MPPVGDLMKIIVYVQPELPNDLFPHLGPIRWYTKTAQADLEARGLIERVPNGKPLRLRRRA